MDAPLAEQTPPLDTRGLTERVQEELEILVSSLSVEEKVLLLTGSDLWHTNSIDRIGLRRMRMSDGPSGVRGERWDERDPSLNLPSATALSSSWDPEIARRYGDVSAAEAQRKDVDIILGPTINLHRSPLGGRHFEAFSEDPHLTGRLAAAYVQGVQARGVAATPKHYVANDFETERYTASAHVSEQTLRELYLAPFEAAVREGEAWAVMSAYNSINGVTASENQLLEMPLKSEWAFDGVVVSDWTAVRSLESAKAAQDLAMPGPDGPWGQALLAAVRHGEVTGATIDAKVLRLLRLARRVGALGEESRATPAAVVDGRAFAREAAAAGSVLLANREDILPLTPDCERILVVGHNAAAARTQGGGSATVVADRIVSPLEGIREAFPNSEVSFTLGAVVHTGISALPLDQLHNPETGEPGVRFDVLRDGEILASEDRLSSELIWFGSDLPLGEAEAFVLRTGFVPETDEELRIGFATVGHVRFFVGERLIADTELRSEGDDPGAALFDPPLAVYPVRAVAGQPLDLRFEWSVERSADPGREPVGFRFGSQANDTHPEQLIADAVEQARAADTVIVVVGTNSAVESEGFDRRSLALPGRQDELVHRLAEANPRTIVVVNSGSPVLMPWRDDVRAIVATYFGGQEIGHALGDMLTGAVEPGGRLPTTWPADEFAPVLDVTPRNGVLEYAEGIHIGYRAWLRSGRTPAFPFGFGLGYTTWSMQQLRMRPTGDAVSMTVTNTGSRCGKTVVQVYAERARSDYDRPARWLVGFVPVELEAGEACVMDVPLAARWFATWNDGWIDEPGDYALRAGWSVMDLPLELGLTRQVGDPNGRS